MFDWLKARLTEPSTYAGLAAVMLGVGQVAKVKEIPAAADAVSAVGQSVAANPTWGGVLMGAFGALAVILRERGKGL